MPALVVFLLAARASAESAPQQRTPPIPFAAAGAPREEQESADPPGPAPKSIGYGPAERDLPLPDDVPVKPGQQWRRPFEKSRMTLEAHLGFGTSVGVAGMMFEYSFLPQLSVAAGAGLGSGPRNALHTAVAARVRPIISPGEHYTAVLEAAFSTGGYQRFELGTNFVPAADGTPTPAPVGPSATWAHFLQFEGAVEHRSDKGFMMRIGGGVATMLNPGDLRCVSSSASSTCASLHDNEFVAVLDFAVGQSF